MTRDDMTDKTTVTPIATETDDELYCQYQGQSSRQPVILTLDTETGTLSAAYSSIIGSGQSMRSFHRLDLEWVIPPLRMRPLAWLMEAIHDDCQTILDGANVEWDGSNYVGQLSEAALAAAEEIERHIEDMQHDASDVWEPWAASEYYAPLGSDAAILAELGLSAYSTDDEIETRAAVEVADAEVVLDEDDVTSYLRQCQIDERYELDAAADGEDLELAREAAIKCGDIAQVQVIDRAIDGDTAARDRALATLSPYAVIDRADTGPRIGRIIYLPDQLADDALIRLLGYAARDVVALPDGGDVGDHVAIDEDGVAAVVDQRTDTP